MNIKLIKRREFLQSAASASSGIVLLSVGMQSCGISNPESQIHQLPDDDYVILYDTYAMALYFDGGLGPQTGIIKVDDVIAGKDVKFTFWHGHGGKDHKFTVTEDHFKQIKLLKKVIIETSIVDDHSHKLFIDVSDKKWRVPGAQPIKVPK